MTSTITFKSNAVRTINSPSQKAVTTYFAYVNFRDLPKDLPLDVNPRKPKMNTSVAKALINAVQSPDTDFDINNRGIVIVAKSFKFNTNDSTVNLDLGNDPLNYGILDGGHTYTAIIEGRKNLSNDINKFVKLEIIVGEDLTVSRIADARNTSASVSDIALYELDDKFDFIKTAVKDEPYAHDIAIKDNSKERLQIIELLKLLYSYNVYKFTDSSQTPTQAYSGKATVFKDVKKDLDDQTNYYYSLSSLLPDLVRLYDHIELDFRNKYLEYNPTGKFGALRGIEKKKDEKKSLKTLFLENDIDYKVASGYILPVFGAFRVLIKKDGNNLSWRVDPIEMWDKIGSGLIKNTFESSRNNPQDAGKNTSIWSNNYSKAENEMFRQMLEKK
ncbi:AIPR family protein [Listeria seeligeri]|uniref:AIPR family protein n=1 Tax=Listeria seeligeri TaxID=1640 RepID=UPI001624D71F|nr:AIPR family protein [Listeria seeligeri]MBC1470763.1 abortive phage infection protein [Listeria seeligeri]